MSGPSRLLRSIVVAWWVLGVAAPAARAEWMQADASFRDAQMLLRSALRDTVGRGDDVPRLDTLGVALLRLGRTDDARHLFERVLSIDPTNAAAEAALGKLALFAGRVDEARQRLTAAGDAEGAKADLYALRLRSGDWAAAAQLAREVGDEGRIALLDKLSEGEAYALAPGPERARVPLERLWPVPIVEVKLNGQGVLMVLDIGAGDLLIDPSAFRVCHVQPVAGQRAVLWNGSRVAVNNAIVQSLEIAGFRLRTIPAGVISLRKYSLDANPNAPGLAGVIGLQLLRRLSPTIDWARARLELVRPGAAPEPIAGDATRVPFELWGDGELMVQGAVAAGRRVSMIVSTGLPDCGVAGPQDFFEEIGIKPGVMARLVKGAGQYLQGRPWAQGVASTVTIGALASEKLHAWIGALDLGERWRHGVRRDAIVGPDFFNGRRVTFDWAKQELVVETR